MFRIPAFRQIHFKTKMGTTDNIPLSNAFVSYSSNGHKLLIIFLVGSFRIFQANFGNFGIYFMQNEGERFVIVKKIASMFQN